MTALEETLVVRALHTQQKEGVDTYSFFIPGSRIVDIADISRIERDDADQLKGFQRKGIQNHVSSIVEYLNQGQVLFPNAIILSLIEQLEFKQTRGMQPQGVLETAVAGTLHIPIRGEGQRVAWIVDGQQRSLALAQAENATLPVPVVAFVSPDLEEQRQQFILVNKARPLPSRLISELLPEVDILLPRDLTVRKLPSELCNLLSRDPDSPFHGLINRYSDGKSAVITDSAIEKAISKNLRPPLGALNQYKGLGQAPSDTDSMYQTLIAYWSAVRDVFPEAWGKPSTKSRLMHSAGIRAMGSLMDQVMLRADGALDRQQEIKRSLERLKPHCHWTEGVWDGLGWAWNAIESTDTQINRLADYLGRLDRELSRHDS